MAPNSRIDMLITSREKDLGGFTVRRILPYASHRMVGPFIFFDHMGPADLKPGQGMDVRPHPHINLATVTYLFEGRIQHRDSLGSNLPIEPGAINWMIAGKGIVHSERTPEPERTNGTRVNGIQLWVALPEEFEEVEPSFAHHPKHALPEFTEGDAKVKLLLGNLFGHTSPVLVHSNLFYAEINLAKGKNFQLKVNRRDSAVYVVEGKLKVDTEEVLQNIMAVAKPGEDLLIHALEDTKFMIIGGDSVGPRQIYWNFVSSSKERLEEAKRLWAYGPQDNNERFLPIPNDAEDFIPLPNENLNPKGTIM